MLNAYGEFYEALIKRPKGLPTIGRPRRGLHLATGMIGDWDALEEGGKIGTFWADTGALFTANRGEFRFEGERLTASDEIEIALLEIPCFLGQGKDAFKTLSIKAGERWNDELRIKTPPEKV